MRRCSSIITWVLTISAACSATGRAQDGPVTGGRNLDLYFVDVMGGAATLLVTPAGESVLIDSGWPGFDDRDPKRIVHVLKDVAKLERLDHVVTTHWHTDHYGGIEGLAKLVPIGQYWDRGLPEDKDPSLDFPDGPKPDDPLAIAYRQTTARKRRALKPADTIPLAGEVQARVLASGGKVTPLANNNLNPECENCPPDQMADQSDNARSLVLRFTLGKFGFLDCGDLTWNVEKMLVCPVDRIGPIDVFQVTHHGANTSNHPTLLKTIAPTVAIMDNGPRKGGAPETVKALRGIPSIQAFYQLHRNVSTSAEENTDPSLIANGNPTGGQFIHVSVAPDGSKYSVQIGTDGARREFQTK